MNYSVLYGVDLDSYCDYIWEKLYDCKNGKEMIIKKTEADLELLQNNYMNYANRNKDLSDEELYIVDQIKKLISKKRKHLNRLIDWKNNIAN